VALLPNISGLTAMKTDLESTYLEALGKGGHQAFDVLFRHYHPKVSFFLKGFIKDEEVARDMAQDIFVKVWTNRETISKVDSFKNYLFRMAKNMIYDYYEHCSIKEKYTNRLSEQAQDQYTDILEEEIFVKELALLIDIVIEKMPPQRKLIFIKSRKEGLSNEAIAHELNISRRTVENHITQALNDIRKSITTLILFFL
jgi:RNA polymerase sigma-70 factor (ECF subfamily)